MPFREKKISYANIFLLSVFLLTLPFFSYFVFTKTHTAPAPTTNVSADGDIRSSWSEAEFNLDANGFIPAGQTVESIRVKWQNPNVGPIADYFVSVYPEGSTVMETLSLEKKVPASTTAYIVSGITNGGLYNARIRAKVTENGKTAVYYQTFPFKYKAGRMLGDSTDWGGGSSNYVVFKPSNQTNINTSGPVTETSAEPVIAVSGVRGQVVPFQFALKARRPLGGIEIGISRPYGVDSNPNFIPTTAFTRFIVGPVKRRMSYQKNKPEYNTFYEAGEILYPYEKLPLEQGKVRQWWFNLKIPDNAVPGNYQGTISILPDNDLRYTIGLKVRVYGFTLSDTPANKVPGFYYRSPSCTIMRNGSVVNRCSDTKNQDALIFDDLQRMRNIGVRKVIPVMIGAQNPQVHPQADGTIFKDYAPLVKYMDTITTLGFREKVPFVTIPLQWVYAWPKLTTAEAKSGTVQEIVRDVKNLQQAHPSWPEIVFYPSDEPEWRGDAGVALYGELASAIKKVPGAKTYVTTSYMRTRHPTEYAVTDYLSYVSEETVAQNEGCPPAADGKICETYTNMNHTGGRLDFNRKIFGFWFYKSDFTAQVPWAYNAYSGGTTAFTDDDPYTDEDGGVDWAYTYPDPKNPGSSLGSLILEGVREGIYDLRYINTLQAALSAGGGTDTVRAAARSELAALKNTGIDYSNPASYDLERKKIARLIGQLKAAP